MTARRALSTPKKMMETAMMMASTRIRALPRDIGVYLLRIWATMSVPPVFDPPLITKPVPTPMASPPKMELRRTFTDCE